MLSGAPGDDSNHRKGIDDDQYVSTAKRSARLEVKA
jgi:hypothetical protein